MSERQNIEDLTEVALALVLAIQSVRRMAEAIHDNNEATFEESVKENVDNLDQALKSIRSILTRLFPDIKLDG